MPDDATDAYICDLFATEDAPLRAARERHDALGLPPIHVSPDEGRLLFVLLRSIGARRVLEIGTLGGYSGIWIARALPADGRLVTIEREPAHAEAAARSFAEAGVADRIEQLVGDATERLASLEPPFDAVFVDADKEPMPHYYQEAMRLLRPGGLLLGDNAFFHGRVLDPDDRGADVEGIRTFARLAAEDPSLDATIVPVRDGLVVGVKRPA